MMDEWNAEIFICILLCDHGNSLDLRVPVYAEEERKLKKKKMKLASSSKLKESIVTQSLGLPIFGFQDSLDE